MEQSGPSQNEEERLDRTKVKSEYLDEKRGPRGPYNDMDAAITEVLECNIDDIPKDMKFIGFKDVDEYDRISYVRRTRYKVAILEDKYGKCHDYFVPADEEKAADRRPPMPILSLGLMVLWKWWQTLLRIFIRY